MIKKLLAAVLIWGWGFQNAICQNPLVKQWDYRFGGTLYEWIVAFQQTADGGYILGGSSNSGSNGDKTQPNWDPSGATFDYWIVKIDSLGNKQWDKRFGGIQDDLLQSLEQTTDGGYLLGGYSMSGISGDKTQNSWFAKDYWIVKIDASGNKQWDKDFGGTANDQLFSLQQTTDGGYILGGYSWSGISGDKTDPNCNGVFSDYWIVKIDSLGNKQWDKDFGGDEFDELYSLQQTTDGGYILGGRSISNSSCDKTQNVWGWLVTDYWIIKTDSLGNKQWDKDLGGTSDEWLHSLQQTEDGGYILGGFSHSDSSGDKTQDSWGSSDYWIIKIDSIGNKQWDKDLGGFLWEYLYSLQQTADKGYILAGYSGSGISGDKTENNLGSNQSWVVKIDSLGNKEWDNTIFTTGSDNMGLGIQSKEGCFVIANSTAAGVGGYKTQPNWDTTNYRWDFWIIKFCDTTLTTNIQSAIQNSKSSISISPNPATDKITISFPATAFENITLKIFSITGEVVFEQKNKSAAPITKFQIPVFNISNGIYFLSVQTGREVVTRKIVVNH